MNNSRNIQKNNYTEYLLSMYDKKTFNRKLWYIKYNFWNYINSWNSILEIGPWLWEFLHYCVSKKNISDITIIDNDKSVLNYCKNLIKEKDIKTYHIEKSIEEIDTKLETYDIIFLNQVLEHIPRDYQLPTLKILYNHLEKWGKLIVNVPNAGNFLTLTEIYWDITHTSAFTENSLKQLSQKIINKKDNVIIQWYNIPPYELINIIRIFFQKILHFIQLLCYMAHGWSFTKRLTPNISLIIEKK